MASSINEIFSRDNFKKNKKLVLLSAAVALLLVAAVTGIAAGASKANGNTKRPLSPSSHAVLRSACSSTLYPELCVSAVAISGGVKLTSQKDVIEASLNLTTTAVEHNYFTVKKLIKNKKGLTPREKTALHDCLETIDELHETLEDLQMYPNKKTLREHAGDLKTLISSAITNQETCLDGFSHDDADKKVRNFLLKGQVHVEHMCSNALAMIKNMTDTDIANFELKAKLSSNNRKLKEEETPEAVDIAGSGELDAEGWPTWLSAGDRRLLQGSSVRADATVAANGSGKFKTIAAAVAAAPDNSKRRYVIHIKAGVYRENVEVSKKKKNIMFMGDGRTRTIITGNRNVVDGSTTFHSATTGFLVKRGKELLLGDRCPVGREVSCFNHGRFLLSSSLCPIEDNDKSPPSPKDYYKILEVDYDATEELIRLNYRKLALKWHPDKHKGDSAALEKFIEINDAYNVDLLKLHEYDLTGIYEIHKNTLREYLARFKGMILTCNGLGIIQSSSPCIKAEVRGELCLCCTKLEP
ncbi:unnamed protein product [Brassica oleracea]